MATGAADGFLRPIYEGCISGYDHCVERRPYHRNCGCVLHSKSKKSSCTHRLPMCNKVKYPMRRAWSEGNLVLAASSHSSPSPSNSPATLVGQLSLNVVPQILITILTGKKLIIKLLVLYELINQSFLPCFFYSSHFNLFDFLSFSSNFEV